MIFGVNVDCRLALWAAAHAPLALLDLSSRSITIEIEMLWVECADQGEGLQWLLNELVGFNRRPAG